MTNPKSKSGRDIACRVLQKHKPGIFADGLLEQAFHQWPVDQRERSLATELVYGVIRWQARLDHVIKQVVDDSGKKIGRGLLCLLRLGTYQILFCSRIPDHAAVSTMVDAAKSEFGPRVSKFVNAVLRKVAARKGKEKYPDPKRSSVAHISTYYSHPAWLVERWIARFGFDNAKALCIRNNQAPAVHIRANQKRIQADGLAYLLKEQGIETGAPKGRYVRLSKPGNMADIVPLQEGMGYVQDPASGLVVDLMDLKGYETVFDVCAAPGGKATDIAERLLTGRIFACDLSYVKVSLLLSNLKRMGFQVWCAVADGARPCFREGLFDTVLIDAPCSNTGVFAKRVESRWERKFADLKRLAELQHQLLVSGANLARLGGVVVYSTCSIEPEENQGVVERFLSSQDDFKLESAEGVVPEKYVQDGFLQVLPHEYDIDGMFGARLVRVK